MQLSDTCLALLDQLSGVIHQIDEEDFARPSEALSRSTVGQHLRHTIEFFICLEEGVNRNIVNYDARSHDALIETDKTVALKAIQRICEFIGKHRTDCAMKLEVGYEPNGTDVLTLDTNYFRELIYNIEHTVHHMAIMKIGIREVAPYVRVPSDFGVAASTIRYRESLAVERS